MENQITEQKEQIVVLSNKKNLSVSGTNKIISLSNEIIQLDTVYGNMQILGQQLELVKLDNTTTRAEINGQINEIKYIDKKQKVSLFRKIFK